MTRPRLAIVPTSGQRDQVARYRAKIGATGPSPVPPPPPQPKTQTPASDAARPPSVDPGSAIEHLIGRLMAISPLSPSTRVCLEGSVRHVEAVEVPPDDPGGDVEVGFRNVTTAPLEALFHSKRNPLELYQYLAGCRFRMDWHLSQLSPLGAVDYTRGAMYVTDALSRHAAQGYVPGIDGPALATALRAVVNPTPDTRLDAMDRVGKAIKALSQERGWVAQRWIGEEWPLRAMAKHLGCDERVINWLARRMLDELAAHYRLRAGRGKS